MTDISASGTGSGVGSVKLVDSLDPITQMVVILDDASIYEPDKPDRIAPIWEYSHNDRINYPNPALYIYAPTEASINKFSIDGNSANQTKTIEILIMTLDEIETRGYQSNVISALTQLYDDNQQQTAFHRFGNITASDIRNEHITQQTDHYIASVTVEVQKFSFI